MPKSLRPTAISHRVFADPHFHSLFGRLVALAVLGGVFTAAAAQGRPEEAGSDHAATGQQQGNVGTAGATTSAAEPAAVQGLIHIVPYGRNSSTFKTHAAPFGAHLTYFGGPVISNIQVVVVFWGPNVTSAITSNGTIDQFYTDITSSRFFDELTEYTTAGVTGAPPASTSSNQNIGHGTFGGKFTITPSVCPGTAPCTVTDIQIQAELTNQINAHALPAPQSDVHGIVNTYYAIYFPPGVSINLDGTPSCVIGGFCAYHSNTASLIPYGVLPDMSAGACSTGCGNGTVFENITSVSSHEMSEATTDAQVGSATVFGPPLAWYDNPPNLGEVADLCVGQDVHVSAGSSTYMIQQNFSNVQNDCVSAPPVFNMTSPTSGAGPNQPFNLTLKVQSSVSPFSLSGYTGTVHFTSADPLAILPADYTFQPADAGEHVFSVTLGTLGDQTITVTDTRSSGFNGTATINVNTTPDMAIAKSHTGNFIVGQTGATYTLVASNVGHGPTAGTVTVTDTLPSGLTATAIAGPGWTCTLGTLTCTRADALAATASYPPITLTVNVLANAPSLVTNVASVSGGGETNTANDSASDPTIVLAPDLTIFKSHFGPINGNFFQGETGATYAINVQNSGTLATFGSVTVTDTLPSGLTATDISGAGWTCTLATLTCTRSDVLATFTSYPPITLTMDIPIGAPASVVNAANVSGGGEVNTANDSAQDFTTILPPPAPDLTLNNLTATPFIQGQTGVYQITVTNAGTKITSGAVTLTDTLPVGLTATSISGIGWTCSLGTPLTCTRSDALDFNLSYPMITLNVNIAADAPSSVTNVATVSGGGDSNNANNSATNTTPVAAPVIDLVPAVSGTAFVSQGQTNVNFLVFAQNNGNISTSGPITIAVTLSTGVTATAFSGTDWNCTLSTLTCTSPDALGSGGNSFFLTLTVNVANNAPASGNITASVSGGGDSVSANNNISSALIIQPMVSITPLNNATAVTAGQPAQFSLIVNPLPSAGGPASLSCSGLPAASSCVFTPSSVPDNVGGQFVTLVISTTARSVAVSLPPGNGGRKPLLPMAALGAVAIAAMLLKRLRLAPRRRLALALTALVLLLAGLSGCGGGGVPQQIVTQQGTPPGTYPITVTAATPNETATTVMTLTVR